MSKPVKVVCPLLLVLLLLFQLSCYHGMTHSSPDFRAKAAEASMWQVYYEGRDKSAYRLNVGKYVSGLEIWLFINTSDSYAMQNESIFNNDYIELTFVSNPIVVVNATGLYIVESIVGLSKIGYEGDHEKSVGGLHGIYYVLPKSSFVSYVNITLYAAYSTPRLDMARSFVREWNPLVDIVQLETGSKGWYRYEVTQDCKGRASIISFGIPIGDRPTSSGLTWYFGKRIRMPNLPSPCADVYVEVGYAGGINIAPEPSPYAGQGAYRCKINVGIGPGPDINHAVAFGHQETVYASKKYPLGAVIEHAADGCIDIESAFLEELASEVGAEFMEKILEVLDYIRFVLEIAEMFKSLEFDEKVAENKILVFRDFPIGESLIAFFNFYAETATVGLTGGIVNFWGECPFGQPPIGLAVNLGGDGGMQIGGVLLDYHEERFPENLIFIREDGYIYPPTPLIVSDDSRVYRLTDDINATLIIKRDNIILDGCGHTLRGGAIVAKKEDKYGQKPVENVTITSMRIEGGAECSRLGYEIHVTGILAPNIEESYEWSGIILDGTVNAAILNDTIVGCQVGIAVWEGKNCTILGNSITNAGAQPSLIIYAGDETGGHNVTSIGTGIGVMLNNAEQTLVSENMISSCEVGIFTEGGITNITRNHLVDNDFGVWADGVEAISHNYIFQCRHGISNDWTRSWMSYEKNIFRNTILNCYSGINVWVGRCPLQILHNYVINCTEIGIRAGSWSAIYSPEDEEAARKRNISENEVLNCTHGIIVTGRITASRNNVTKCTYGMAGYDQSIIEKNNVANCIYGISAPGQFTAINKNNVVRCTYGITIGYHSHIEGNNIIGCAYGIAADEKTSLAANVGGNDIRDCVYGIDAGNADLRNTIYGNNLTRCTYGITGGEYIKENKIVKCTYGITTRSNWGIIERNDIGYCEYGITAPKEADELKVIENNLRDCTHGILGGGIIEENNVMNCNYGITGLIRSAIHRNNVINCTCGIIITGPSNPYWGSLNSNNITYCHKGILMEEKRGYMIRRNNLVKNDFGIYIAAKLNTNYTITENSSTISHNNFIMNNVSIFVEDDNLHHVVIYIFNNNFIENGQTYGEPPQCVWNEILPTGGNYWSNYEGVDEKSGENQDEPGADGIGDKPYLISGKAVDRYPLMEPFGNLPSITIDYTVREWVITLTTNSAISNFKCNLENKVVSLYVQGKSGTRGFISINIPKSIVSREVEVLFDGRPIPFNRSETADNINIGFTYEHTKHYVEIRFGAGGGVLPQLSTQNYIAFVVAAAGLLLIALLLALYLRRRRVIPSKAEPLPPPPPPP